MIACSGIGIGKQNTVLKCIYELESCFQIPDFAAGINEVSKVRLNVADFMMCEHFGKEIHQTSHNGKKDNQPNPII